MNTASLIKDISTKLNVTKKYAEYLLTGKRFPSRKLAPTLERITGVDRRAWLWPDEFHNPLLVGDSARLAANGDVTECTCPHDCTNGS